MSPRRYAGWEPLTQHIYDDEGHLTGTRPEPEWDEWDNALLDALENWQAGVHSCGHHESEQATPGTIHQAGYTICRACEALQKAQEAQSALDEPERKKGRNPDYPRRWRVWWKHISELTTATDPERKTAQQQMNEAVAKLDQPSVSEMDEA